MPKDKKPSTQDTQEAIEIGKLLMPKYSREDMPESFTAILQNADKAIKNDLETLKKSREMETIKSLFPDAAEWLDANGDRALYASFVCFMIYDAAELIQTVYLKEQGGKASLSDFTRAKNGKSKLGEFFSQIREKDGSLVYLYNIRASRPEYMPLPLDKLNANLWRSQVEPKNGKYELTVHTGASVSKKKKKAPLVIPAIFYTIDFTTVEADFPFVKRLTEYDKRVCCAICSILDAGQYVMSIDEIYYSMGYTKSPDKYSREKIDHSLTKMRAVMHVDNKAEIAAGLKYEPFEYDGNFLYFERIKGRVTINGKEIKDPVHILQYPRVIEIAKSRGQFQAVPMAALQSENNRKTEKNLAIEDYLLQRIAEAKRDRQPAKIKYETMYKKLRVEGKTERQRMRETAKSYMDHYEKTGWIDSYTVEKDGLSFEIH